MFDSFHEYEVDILYVQESIFVLHFKVITPDYEQLTSYYQGKN